MALRPGETVWQVIVVDSTECLMEQPQGKGAQKSKTFFSGKK